MMGLYRKRPVVIDAIQFKDCKEGLVAVMRFCPNIQLVGASHIRIPTLEGWMTASPGDWIIKGVKGEFYPCKPDIFEQTYEPA